MDPIPAGASQAPPLVTDPRGSSCSVPIRPLPGRGRTPPGRQGGRHGPRRLCLCRPRTRSTVATRATAPRSHFCKPAHPHRGPRHERRTRRRRARRCPRAQPTSPPRLISPRLGRLAQLSCQQPALTTVGQSLHDQGRTCARLLITATRDEIAADDLVHLAPWQLITRDSTGSPPPT